MPLFAPALAFIDLETTGIDARRDDITEVGVVRVDVAPGDEVRVATWTTLLRPAVPIPAEIEALTGITNTMVRSAPRFAEVAAELRRLLSGALLVAHNARFDYAFVKHAFARLGERFTARVLCTVKLSRRLFPDEKAHGLDALIARHALHCPARHRALPDATVLWGFVQAAYRTHAPEAIEACVRGILRTPSLPPHLAPDALEHVPEAPGVYLFYGDNALPLYIGKSRNLRERVGAHFSSDHRSATDLRLSREVRRIVVEESAGEIGALLRESMLVKRLLPAHNHALRRKRDAGILVLDGEASPPRFVALGAISADRLAGAYGPFGSRRHARALLADLAHAHGLCWTALGLERRQGPCFARQVRRCLGVCVGAESTASHDERLRAALSRHRIPAWPCEGPAVLRESAEFGGRVDAHVLDAWCWIGTARDEREIQSLVATRHAGDIDVDIVRLLIARHRKRALPLCPIDRAGTAAFAAVA